MAIFKSSLFHRLRNGLGNVVAYYYCGKGVLRSKPLHVRNPKTTAQQQARLRFKAAGHLSAYFREVALLGFPAPYAVQSHNAFIGANIQMFDLDENLQVHPDFRRLVCAQGKLEKPVITVKVDDHQFTAEISEQNLSAYCSRNDDIYAVLWDCKYPAACIVPIGKRQGHQSKTFSYPDKFKEEHMFVYVFAVSANGKQTSDSLLLFAEGKNVMLN
ncbi:DUF6266 family protein [Odoribacter lunatus]|uniref:DUF6266 family protein n=1 Tax=Odoribacter lunatus TaxID=2941335 RepID=UPI002041E391|nr:DUF6266 family protein [Odoribacter lunatus]